MLIKIASWITAAVLCSWLVRVFLLTDHNKRVYAHVPGMCTLVQGAEGGSEDMVVLTDGKALIVTAGGLNRTHGGFLLFDLDGFSKRLGDDKKSPLSTLRPKASKLTVKMDFELHPIAITSWTASGRTFVHVVNRRATGDTIEAFVWSKGALTHSKTITDGAFTALTDIAAIGPDKFYVTSAHYFGERRLQRLEMLSLVHLGSVVLYDGAKTTTILDSLPAPYGIAIDHAHNYVFVSLVLTEQLRVFKLERDLTLTYHLDMSLMTMPHHIYIHPTSGEIWLAAHAVAHRIFEWMDEPTVQTPSQVLRVRMQEDRQSWVTTEPYADDGERLSGASVAVYHKEIILIGTLLDKIMLCEVLNEEYT